MQESTNHLPYLIAAFSVIWVLISFYVVVLTRRNRRLSQALEELEQRLATLEKNHE